VLIAGLILSSFHPERIKSKPHHNIKRIDSRPADKTNKEIARRINSQKSICVPKTAPA
jgi:hypothetical protein